MAEPSGEVPQRRGGGTCRPAARRETLVFESALRRTTASRKVWLVALGVAGLSRATAGAAMAGAVPGAGGAAAPLNVKTFGAKGDGNANDAAAINKAITAANAA